jgi:light-regulated signal transduction histidine kinase (bacteriophytochrome)
MSSLTAQANAQPLPGLEGDDNWTPSAEDILESTTNYAKPLLALERIRKLNQVAQPPFATDPVVGTLEAASDGSGSVSSAHTRRSQRRKTSGTVGMMDIFAVMSQINEQLGAASDLDTFLKVVVGLIKDLTQFHRVLVYQFDEHWNGKTVAELVDWNRTHDLYRGLHFPASDIPAQVGWGTTIKEMWPFGLTYTNLSICKARQLYALSAYLM